MITNSDTKQNENIGEKPDLKWTHFSILVLISMLGPFTQDFYMPMVPAMMEEFDATAEEMAWVFLANLLVLSLCSFIVPYQSDIIGRKKTLVFNFILLLIGTVICILAQTVPILLVGRCIQAIGETSMIIPDAMIRDLVDDPNERVKKMGIIASLKPIGLMMAPVVGGILGNYFGWRWNFGVLLIGQVLVLLGIIFILFETVQWSNRGGIQQTLCEKSQSLASSWYFIGPCGTMTMVFQVIFLFITTNTYTVQNYYGYNSAYSGLFMGMIGFSGIVGGSTAIKISHQMKKDNDKDIMKPLRKGHIYFVIPILLFTISACGLYKYHVLCFVVPLMIFVGFNFFFLPFVSVIATERFKHMAGFLTGTIQACRGAFPVPLTDYVNKIFEEDDFSPFWPFFYMIITAISIQIWFWCIWSRKVSFTEEHQQLDQTESKA